MVLDLAAAASAVRFGTEICDSWSPRCDAVGDEQMSRYRGRGISGRRRTLIVNAVSPVYSRVGTRGRIDCEKRYKWRNAARSADVLEI